MDYICKINFHFNDRQQSLEIHNKFKYTKSIGSDTYMSNDEWIEYVVDLIKCRGLGPYIHSFEIKTYYINFLLDRMY
jgi:hypothetical protein